MNGPWAKLSSKLIDTHCHLHHYSDPEISMKLTNQAGIKTHMVTVRPDEFLQWQDIRNSFQFITPCLGLFPLYVDESEEQLQQFFTLLKKTRFIGEVGLDYTADELHRTLQRKFLQKLISNCHELGDRILSVHSRRSAEDIFKIIGESFNGKVIMHWYSGSIELAQNAPDNFYFSINTAMLKSRNGKELINHLKPEQILTETDGPYIKINDQPALPSDIKNVIQSLSLKWHCSLEECLNIIQQNYDKCLKTK
jgi:TatD DNase family protein